MSCLLVILSTVVVIVGRFMITPRLDVPTPEGSYEAFAHLFVAGLFGYWWARKGTRAEAIYPEGHNCMLLAVILSLFELAMFLYQKYS